MIRKYLYREDDFVFYKLEQVQEHMGEKSFRVVMTSIIDKGITNYCYENHIVLKKEREKEKEPEQTGFVLIEDEE